MAERSLNHEAGTRQSQSPDLKTWNDEPPDTAAFRDMFQVVSFSLTFTSSQWCLFWRLLNVGCMLADELLDLVENPHHTAKPKAALLWNALSTELAALFRNGGVDVSREKEKTTR